MAGIYVHIPFCKKKCHYCNFFTLASKKHKALFLESLQKEILLQKNYLKGDLIETIYLGGGTPSLLTISEIAKILDSIRENYPISNSAEIDIETNPDDLDEETLIAYKSLGINRLSIGTQSFDDVTLNSLNRVHTAQQAIDSVRLAKKIGFDNISIDLIYGIPGLSNEKWKKSIESAISLEIPHLSAYHLTVEPNTALEVLIRKKQYPKPVDEEGVEHFNILSESLQSAGYEHYEISNYALPGKYSIHNTNYWRQQKYLGLGPSAHSYNLESRQWNIASITKYNQALSLGKLDYELEKINIVDQYNEFVMLGLRTQWGINIDELLNRFGEKRKEFFERNIQKYIVDEKVFVEHNIYKLTQIGKAFADGIASDVFIDY